MNLLLRIKHGLQATLHDYCTGNSGSLPFVTFPSWTASRPESQAKKRTLPQADSRDRGVKLSSLASENGYRRIRRMYRDRKEVDAEVSEDCVRVASSLQSTLPSIRANLLNSPAQVPTPQRRSVPRKGDGGSGVDFGSRQLWIAYL